MMGTLNPYRFLILCGLFLIVNKISADDCRKGCLTSDTGKFKYLPGSIYEYNFNSIITISINNTDNEEVSLTVNGIANLYPKENCAYILKLDKVNVHTSSDSLLKQLNYGINKPIQFTLSNGELEPQLCADSTENEYALNIKRGIISLIQSSDKSYETDIFGVCPTVTSTTLAGDANIITKVRNLNSCGYRENIISGMMTGIIDDKSGVKSTSYLYGDYTKEQKLVNGVIENVELIEDYKLLSPTKSIYNTKVKTNMILTKTHKGPAPVVKNIITESIIFSHSTPLVIKNLDALKKALEQTINLVDGYAKSDSATHFTELIRLMRHSDAETLTELSTVPHQNQNLARKVYLDALFRTATSESIKAIVKQMPKMNEKEKRYAFISFNLVHIVTKDALSQVSNLLSASSPREAYLSIGNLVNKYCKHENCDQREINNISKKFVDSLKHCKANTKREEDRIVGVLKGIRNTHKIADASVQQLIECTENDRSSRVRVAAIQSFTAASCNVKLQEKAIAILKDQNEDSEIRIEAYLVAVACPNNNVANEIAAIVNSETVHQVGGFITTHLKAIRDSTDFTRESARHHLGNIRVTKKFPIDSRRYSFNSELSYAIESMGIGASADYNVIYSQNGFLPRSGKLNLTSVIFGQSFNAFEINARQENLEGILEYYFGPKGFFERYDYNGNIVSPRSKRAITEETNKMSKKYKTYGNSKFNNDINLDFALKMFGTEIAFLSLGDDIPSSVEELNHEFEIFITKMKNGLKKFERNWEYHSLFDDTQIVYPTGVGLPLEIVRQGAATGKLDFAVEIDVDRVLEKVNDSKFRLKMVPSLDISINGLLRIDGGVLATGLRTTTNLHSASGGDLKVEIINDATGFNIDLDIPRENLELIELKYNSDFFVTEQNKETKIVPFKNSKKRKSNALPLCFDQLQLFGMTICYTAGLPDNGAESLGYPLFGPAQMGLTLQSERKISLKGLYEMHKTHQSWQLKFDTPGSKKAHNTMLQFELGVKPKLYARLNFEHPEKQMAAEAGLENDEKEFAVYSKIEMDRQPTLHKIGFTKNGNEYRPLIKMSSRGVDKNDIAGYKTDGRVLVSNNGEKYDFDNFRIIRPTKEATTINGWIQNDNTHGLKSELKVSDGGHQYKINSYCSTDPSQGFSIGAFVADEALPDSTIGGSLFFHYAENNFKQKIVYQSGVHKFELENEFNHDGGSTKFLNELKLNNNNAIAASGKLNGEFGEKILSCDFEATRNDKRVAFNMKYAQDQKAQGDFDLNMLAKFNRHFIDLKAKTDVKNGKFMIDNMLITSWGTKATAKGEVGQKMTGQDGHIDVQGTVQFTNKDKESHWSMKMQCENEKSKTEFKLNRDKIEMVHLNFELMRPSEKASSGHVDMMLKDTLTAKGKFDLAKNGRGTLSMLVNLHKNNREVKIESKYLIQAPKYDIDTTITFDGNKKITYKTENIIDRIKFNTRNALSIGTEKLAFDASASVKGADWVHEGDFDGKFDLTLPTGRKMNGNIARKVSMKAKTGTIDIVVNDAIPNEKKRSISVKGKATDFDVKTKSFNVHYDIVYNDMNDKTIEVGLDIKHLPKGHFKMAEIGMVVGGTILPDPMNLNFVIDEYCPEHAIFRLSGKHGNNYNGNINGNYQMMTRNEPMNYAVQANINVPDSEHKTYKFSSNGKFIQPQTENGVIEAEIMFDHHFGDKQTKISGTAKGNKQHGSYRIDTNCPWHGPMNFGGNYVEEENDDTSKFQYGIFYDLGHHGGNLQSNVDINVVGDNSANLHYTIKSSYVGAKNIDLVFKTEKSDHDTITTSTQLNHNGDVYGLNTVLIGSEHKNGIDVTWTTPTATSKIAGIIECMGERKGKASLNLENVAGIDFSGVGDSAFTSFEDFYIKIDLNSNKLKLNKLHIQANSQAGSNGKGVEFNVTDASEKILSGNAQYNVKQEKGKTVVEGQGSIQYYAKESNANFKLVRQTFDIKRDGEAGFSYNFTGKFGPKNIVSTIKATTKNVHVQLSACEEKKQCTNFEIESLTTVDSQDLSQAHHKLLVLINLLELGYPYEFELLSKTTRNGYKVVHDIEMNIISNNNNKYQFLANLQPNNGLIQFKLPKRSIVLETVFIAPENGIFGKYENSVSFYFDKTNKANEKTQLTLAGNFDGVKHNSVNADFLLKFEHPTVRTMSVLGSVEANREKQQASSKIVFDLFKTPAHQVVGEAKVFGSDFSGSGYNFTAEASFKSAGLGFNFLSQAHSAICWQKNEVTAGSMVESVGTDMKFSTYVSATPHGFEVLLNGLNHEILRLTGKCNTANHKVTIDNKFHMFGSKPLEITAAVDFRGGKLVMKRQDMFDATGEMKIGQEANFAVNGYGKKLYNGKIMLDVTNFLATTYTVEDENVRSFMHDAEVEYKRDMKKSVEDVDKKFRQVQTTFNDNIQKAKGSTPDFSKFRANYEENVNSIVKELEEDPSLKEIIDAYRRTYESILNFMQEFVKTVTESYEKIHKSFVELYNKFITLFKDSILPAWQELISKLTEVFGEFNAELMKIMGTLFERALKSLQTFKEDLNNLGKPFAEILHPIGEMLNDLIKSVAKEWEEFTKDVQDYWNKLPSMKELGGLVEKRLAKLKSVDEFLVVLKDLFDHMEQYSVSPEGVEFMKKLYSYIETKLRNTPINDLEALEGLYYSLVQAVRSVLVNFGETPSSYLLQPLPFSFDALTKIPSWITFKFSPLNYIRNEKFGTSSFPMSYSPPFSFIPPFELQGRIADGQHVFTFDGRHMTFPGTCKYILAQDYVNNNFSVVANLKDGKMKSIIVIDKTNYVEINDKGAITLNNEKTEFPIHDKDMHAWRRYYSLSILSKYGVYVMCSTDLRLCHVNVNGFYTGQVRGLLGNGNAEPYDDFTKPDGLITDDYAVFGNSYGLGSCKPVPKVNVEHTSNEICTQLFGYDSTLRFGYLFIDSNKYREACNDAVATANNKEDAACNIAFAFASACQMENLPVEMPERCLVCKSTGSGQHNFGAELKTTVPNIQADVVFVVDTNVSSMLLGEFIQPTIKDMRDQLKARGFSNINIAVIGYNENQIYPQLFTTNGKMNFEGDIQKMNLNGPIYKKFVIDGDNLKINEILLKIHDARVSFEATDAKAFRMATKYPFRAGAAKTIVVIRNTDLDYGSLGNNFAGLASNYVAQKKGIFFHYIGPISNITVDGVPTDKIVGFNKRAVATLEGKDAKKRSKLQYTGGIGVDLVQDNYGWVFALQNFEKQSSSEQKIKFTQQITSSIADQLFKTNVDYNCRCTIAYSLFAEEQCNAITTTFDGSKKSPK